MNEDGVRTAHDADGARADKDAAEAEYGVENEKAGVLIIFPETQKDYLPATIVDTVGSRMRLSFFTQGKCRTKVMK